MSRTAIATIATAALAIAAAAGILLCGSVDIPPAEVWAALTGGEVSREVWRIIVTDTRLAAALTAALAGCEIGRAHV